MRTQRRFSKSSHRPTSASTVNAYRLRSSHDLPLQDPVPIYWANIVTLVACYGYGFTVGKPDGASGSSKNQPKWLKFIFKVGLFVAFYSISWRVPGVIRVVTCDGLTAEDVPNFVV